MALTEWINWLNPTNAQVFPPLDGQLPNIPVLNSLPLVGDLFDGSEPSNPLQAAIGFIFSIRGVMALALAYVLFTKTGVIK